MKKITLAKIIMQFAVVLFTTISVAQTSIQVFDEVLFYDGYAGLVNEIDLYEPMPPEVLRHSNSRYAVKLTDPQLDMFGNKLELDITLRAACDNYDRIARVYLAFVDKGATTYVSNDVERLEIGRFITPFMNKNISPMEVDFDFTADNIAEILTDPNLRATYDFWVELDVFGVPYAAQTQVAGCAGRIDTFYGSLTLVTEDDPNQTYPNPNFLKTLACDENLNNYNATDVPGETTKIIDFNLTETVEDVTLYIVTSNHGANAGGEEYERRDHYVYLDDNLIHEYIPGGKSCEPFREVNTQGNGIFSPSPRSTRMWLSFSNWCPGDVIPIREVNLGTLTAGSHTIKLDVPDAVFVDNQGYIPVSMYLQNRNSFQEICKDPTDLVLSNETYNSIDADWTENGDTTTWEILYGRATVINDETFMDVSTDPTITITDLLDNRSYSVYVRSICGPELTSNWVGPVNEQTLLGIQNNIFNQFQFYPNPTNGALNLVATQTITSTRIFDALGKEVLSQQIGQSITSIDVSGVTTGIYFMEVTIGNASRVYKFIKK
jgi:Peptide-N-glycosidase F, C terminal/Secretion system C-terminal sorting domain/Peptide-N-glycosidase F, N terminal